MRPVVEPIDEAGLGRQVEFGARAADEAGGQAAGGRREEARRRAAARSTSVPECRFEPDALDRGSGADEAGPRRQAQRGAVESGRRSVVTTSRSSRRPAGSVRFDVDGGALDRPPAARARYEDRPRSERIESRPAGSAASRHARLAGAARVDQNARAPGRRFSGPGRLTRDGEHTVPPVRTARSTDRLAGLPGLEESLTERGQVSHGSRLPASSSASGSAGASTAGRCREPRAEAVIP